MINLNTLPITNNDLLSCPLNIDSTSGLFFKFKWFNQAQESNRLVHMSYYLLEILLHATLELKLANQVIAPITDCQHELLPPHFPKTDYRKQCTAVLTDAVTQYKTGLDTNDRDLQITGLHNVIVGCAVNCIFYCLPLPALIEHVYLKHDVTNKLDCIKHILTCHGMSPNLYLDDQVDLFHSSFNLPLTATADGVPLLV